MADENTFRAANKPLDVRAGLGCVALVIAKRMTDGQITLVAVAPFA